MPDDFAEVPLGHLAAPPEWAAHWQWTEHATAIERDTGFPVFDLGLEWSAMGDEPQTNFTRWLRALPRDGLTGLESAIGDLRRERGWSS